MHLYKICHSQSALAFCRFPCHYKLLAVGLKVQLTSLKRNRIVSLSLSHPICKNGLLHVRLQYLPKGNGLWNIKDFFFCKLFSNKLDFFRVKLLFLRIATLGAQPSSNNFTDLCLSQF
jgi:hypothetical protein